MNKYMIVVCLLFIIFCGVKYGLIELFYATKNENNENKNESILNIKNFTREISVYRPVGSIELDEVRSKICGQLDKLKMKIDKQSFIKYIRNKKYTFSNIIATNPRAKGKYIVLGVHIDSPQIEGCESTIDAATSIAIILELAANILKIRPTFPLMLLFIDGEEALGGKWDNDNTLNGSRYFVENYNLNLIDKVYIFDLIGGNFNNKISCFRDNKYSFNEMEQLSRINKKYDKQIFQSPNIYISDSDVSDDHVPFSKKGIWTMNLIPYQFPDQHHTLDDNYKNVNWEYVDIFYKIFYEYILQH